MRVFIKNFYAKVGLVEEAEEGRSLSLSIFYSYFWALIDIAKPHKNTGMLPDQQA